MPGLLTVTSFSILSYLSCNTTTNHLHIYLFDQSLVHKLHTALLWNHIGGFYNMETSTAEDGAKMAPKNAFDLMMGRDKSILRYKGFRGLGSDIYSLYAVLAELLEDVGREVDDDVAGIDYEEFHERYFHLAIGRVSEAEFQEFWEEGDWETWLCYHGGEGSDGYSSTLGPGATLSDIQDKPKVSTNKSQDLATQDYYLICCCRDYANHRARSACRY